MKLDELLHTLNEIQVFSEQEEDKEIIMLRIIKILIEYINNPKVEAQLNEIVF